MAKKVYASADAALAGLLRDGMVIMSGGFGLCGIPDALIEANRVLTEHIRDAVAWKRSHPGLAH